MGLIVHFPLEQRPILTHQAPASASVDNISAEIIILPVVRIERMDNVPPRVTPDGSKKRRKRA